MIAIVTSLLFGFAASLALGVVWVSLHRGLALGVALLRVTEYAGRSATARQSRAVGRSRTAIFPAEEPHRIAAPPAQTRCVAA
jgi:hypothetical protein